MRFLNRINSFSNLATFLAVVLLVSSVAIGAEISGQLVVRVNDCFNPNHQGPKHTYLIVDPTKKSKEEVELDTSNIDVSSLQLGKMVKLTGDFKSADKTVHTHGTGRVFKAQGVNYIADSTKEAAPESEIAPAAPTLTQLTCLVIFANTNDQPTYSATRRQAVLDVLFNDTRNADKAIQAASLGNNGLVLGDAVTVTLSLNASSTESSTMSTEMINAASGLGFDSASYDRTLVMCPLGTLNGGSPSWTAYANKPGWRSVYSYEWSGTTIDGFVHELGHNFGFSHSSKINGSNQYQDVTCVMGYSHLGNETTPKTDCSTYGAAKKIQLGWMSTYPGSEALISSDATYDLYPVAINPDTTPGMRIVRFNNGTGYYTSYVRNNSTVYGHLWDANDRDKVIIHECSTPGDLSYKRPPMSSGTFDANGVDIIIERYGPSNEYATVSFDFPDTNAKPIANNLTVATPMNVAKTMDLPASDANAGDTLTFSIVVPPTNGALSGTGITRTYTPNSSFIGTDSFVYKVFDGQICSFGTVTITVFDTLSMLLTSPNGGEQVAVGTTQTIHWGSSAGGDVKLELFKGGVFDSTIVASTPNDGAYDWSVPGVAYGTNYTVKITRLQAPNETDTSDANFSIVSPMTMLLPNGGEIWTQSTVRPINWTSLMGGTVKIELYKGGVFDSTIVDSTANDGNYEWLIPPAQAVGTDYSVRITSIEIPMVTVSSAVNFEIKAPSDIILNENLNTNPGFTTSGLFEYGAPAGNNRATAPFTGTNMYDTDLDNTCWTASQLTTPALYCKNHTGITLEFYAYEYTFSAYTIVYEVSNDGVNWTPLYTAVGSNSDQWVYHNYDISAVADGQETVYVRWAFNGGGGQWTGGGLSIDDIYISGTFVPDTAAQKVSVAPTDPTASETNPATNTGLWTISRSIVDATPLTVYFTMGGTATNGSDYQTVSGPVVIPADQPSVTIGLTAIDDAVWNEGDEVATLIITPDVNYGIESGSASITIADNDINNPPSVALNSPTAASVVIPTGVGMILETTVTDDGVPTSPGTVTLAWTQQSGPAGGTATFESPGLADTAVTFDMNGTYVLRLTADDGLIQTTLDVTVNAGGGVAGSPGLWFGQVPGDIDTTTPNPQTKIVLDLATETNSIPGTTTEIFTGFIYDADGNISFTEHIDDKAYFWIDGNLVHSNTVWGTRSFTPNLSLTPGWHAIEIRISNGGGGSGDVNDGGPGIGYDPNGGTAWQTMVDPGDGSFLATAFQNIGADVNAGADGSGFVSAPYTLAGTSTDDGLPDPPAAVSVTWTKASGSGNAVFGNASALNTTVTLDAMDTYVLRLIADDGEVKTFDDVQLTMGPNNEPEINVVRGATPVASGSTDTIPSSEAGVGAQLTYTIQNVGGIDLTLTPPSGATSTNNCSVVIDTPAPNSTVASGGSTDLILTVTPVSDGIWTATISIANNDSNENPYVWTISGTAVTNYTVTFQTDGTAGSSLTGQTSQTVQTGNDSSAVTANAPAGYHFINWTKGGAPYSTNNPLTVTNVTENMTLIANFIKDPSIAITDDGSIVEESEAGEVITVTLTDGIFASPITPANWTISGQPAGVAKGTVTRISDSTVQISLTGNRTQDYDSDITTMSVSCAAAEVTTAVASVSANSGVTFTATNDAEFIEIADDGWISEGSEAGELITVILHGGTFANSLNGDNWTVLKLPGSVSKGTVTRVSATVATIALSGSGSGSYGGADITDVSVGCTTAEYADSAGGVSLSANTGVTLRALNSGTLILQDGLDGYTGTRDTYIDYSNTGVNYGTAAFMQLNNRISPASQRRDKHGLLYFDVSALGPGTVITGVTLDLTDNSTVANTVQLVDATGTWGETTATYSNSSALVGTNQYASATSPGVAGNPVVPSLVLNPSGVALVQDWVNTPSTNYGFAITTAISTNDILELRTREHATQAHRPKLTITYDGGATGPEITVKGQGLTINNGDTTPTPVDDTAFGAVVQGSPVTHTFTIINHGDADLSLTGVSSDKADFSVTQPAGSIIAAGGNRTFTVSFNPSIQGAQTATISVGSNDSDEGTYTFVVGATGDTGGGTPIANVLLPAGISLYGYTGESDIDAELAFQTLIGNSQLSLVRWVNPANGQIKELYYTTFPTEGWVNEIGSLSLGAGYVVKTTASCTLAITGNKSTSSVNYNLPSGYTIIGFNKEAPLDALTAFQPLIDAGKLDLIRWVDPANGSIKELYYTTFPTPGWVNEIGNLTEGQGYIIKLNAPHSGFSLP